MNPIIVCKDQNTHAAVIKMIGETTGKWPQAKRNTVSVDRALYGEHTGRSIVNVTWDIDWLKKLGNPSSAIAFVVPDVAKAREQAVEIFDEYGIATTWYDDLESQFPKGFIVFLTVETLPGLVFLFWPPPPPTAQVKGIPPPEPWVKENDLRAPQG